MNTLDDYWNSYREKFLSHGGKEATAAVLQQGFFIGARCLAELILEAEHAGWSEEITRAYLMQHKGAQWMRDWVVGFNGGASDSGAASTATENV